MTTVAVEKQDVCLFCATSSSVALPYFSTSAQEAFLKSILSKEGKCWSDFFKCVKRRKGNRENTPAIKDCNGRIITDAIEKSNTFNFYYSTVFSNEGNIFHIQGENTGDPFSTVIKTIRRRLKR